MNFHTTIKKKKIKQKNNTSRWRHKTINKLLTWFKTLCSFVMFVISLYTLSGVGTSTCIKSPNIIGVLFNSSGVIVWKIHNIKVITIIHLFSETEQKKKRYYRKISRCKIKKEILLSVIFFFTCVKDDTIAEWKRTLIRMREDILICLCLLWKDKPCTENIHYWYENIILMVLLAINLITCL